MLARTSCLPPCSSPSRSRPRPRLRYHPAHATPRQQRIAPGKSHGKHSEALHDRAAYVAHGVGVVQRREAVGKRNAGRDDGWLVEGDGPRALPHACNQHHKPQRFHGGTSRVTKARGSCDPPPAYVHETASLSYFNFTTHVRGVTLVPHTPSLCSRSYPAARPLCPSV